RQLRRRIGLSCLPQVSAIAKMTAKTINIVATSHNDLNLVSIDSSNSRPSTPMGMDPMMISQPIRTSGSECGTLPTSARHHWAMIRVISAQKYSSTASSVPIWVMAVNTAYGTSAPGKKHPTTRKCAEDEMGKNSVRPCTKPRMTASIQFTWTTLRHSSEYLLKLRHFDSS